MRGFQPVVITLLSALLLAGCSSTPKAPKTADSTAQKVDADEQVLKQDPLERNYDPHVIMKRAESFFEKEDYAEAGVEYQHFLDLHKTHVLAPYAQYRLALSYFKQVTARDRDPEPVRKALEGMEKLLKEYPGSSYEPDARTRIKECREHLAAYELYVGRHYYREEAYLAAIHRFERVVSQYPESEAFSQAAYLLALTYTDLGANDRAIEYLTQLLPQYPKKDKAIQDSRALLAKLTHRPVKEIVASAAPSDIKPSIPPDLPRAQASSPQLPALLPSAEVGLPPMITCSLNVSC
ncbi:MAG TPA: outer membrane protein assembly factor BamD [Nitrospirales bacterium]|jgi:outer membrane protein assembly factor BamD